MEFQAYPSSCPGQKAGKTRSLWQVQNMIHGGCSSVLPIAILASACCLVVYQHMTATAAHHFSTRTFLAMIVVSMIPLALLEKKLLSCSDPLGLLYKFSGKVILMQTIQLALRVFAPICFPGFDSGGFLSTNCIFLMSALVLLPTIFGMRPTKQCIVEQRDVMLLAVLAFSLPFIMALVDHYTSPDSFSVWTSKRISVFVIKNLPTASDYLELISFVPAVWMVCRDKELKAIDVNVARRRAAALITFSLSFYFIEDMYSGVWRHSGQGMTLPVLAHTAHFLLVVDFAMYFLAHLYDPEKFDRVIGKFCDLLGGVYSV